jgi:CO dehydrogenase maturation factor
MKHENQDTRVIAFVGKGGVGKTSITALILDELARNGYPGPVLAVDGDPASTLHLALGLPAPIATVGHVRDHTPLDAKTVRSLPPDLSKTDYVANKLAEAKVLTEYDLRGMPLHYIAMGQSEGAGCYCAVNAALSQVLAEMMGRYSLIVVDSEAGLEHLSRVRLKRVDYLWVVANPTRASISVADQILATVREVEMEIGQSGIILNRARSYGTYQVRDDIICALPEDQKIAGLEASEQPILRLADASLIRTRLTFLLQPFLEEQRQCA